MTEQEQFEAAYLAGDPSLTVKNSLGCYVATGVLYAWGGWQAARATPADHSDTLLPSEVELFEKTIDQFLDSNETDTDYTLLMDWAQRGFLQCTHFEVTEKGNAAVSIIASVAAKGEPSRGQS